MSISIKGVRNKVKKLRKMKNKYRIIALGSYTLISGCNRVATSCCWRLNLSAICINLQKHLFYLLRIQVEILIEKNNGFIEMHA